MDYNNPHHVTAEQTGGGSGGTNDYNQLTNKPQINGVELLGNKTSADLGIITGGSTVLTGADVPSNDMGSDGDYYILQEKSIEDKNTLLLLHGDSLIDNSIYNVPITNSGATVSTAQSKFGESSLYFNGNSNLLFSAQVCDFGAGDFTIDWWEYLLNENCTIFSSQNGVPFTGFMLQYNGTKLCVNSNYNTPNWDIADNEDTFTNDINIWVHFALVRNDNMIYVFKNGVKLYEKNIGNVNLIINTNIKASIGVNAGNNSFLNGYLNEFRISNIARWTENFTPPTEPYNVNTLQAGEIYYKINGSWQKILTGTT